MDGWMNRMDGWINRDKDRKADISIETGRQIDDG